MSGDKAGATESGRADVADADEPDGYSDTADADEPDADADEFADSLDFESRHAVSHDVEPDAKRLELLDGPCLAQPCLAQRSFAECSLAQRSLARSDGL